MKRITLLFMAVFILSCLAAHSQKIETGNAFRYVEIDVDLEENMTPKQFEKFLVDEYLPAWEKNFSDLGLTIMKGERGERVDKYTIFIVFKSLEKRNEFWAEDKYPNEERKKAFNNMGETQGMLTKMTSHGPVTVYEVLPFSGKSFRLKPGNVVSFHKPEFTLEEGMTFDQFEKLYQDEYIPAVRKTLPGTELCLLKGFKGERTGKYVEFLVFESLEERNRWFPEPRKASEEWKKAIGNMREIQSRMVKMVESNTYTDYIVL
ncbi:hypothetical protein ACFLRR_02085 [Bacteroidota bacterium]